MEINEAKTGNLTADITIHLTPEDYREQVFKEIRKQAKKANLPGFRTGKVPFGMAKKMIGKSILIDELNRQLQTGLQEYIEHNALDLIGSPIPKDQRSEDYFDVECDKDLDFTYEVGLSPSFDLSLDLKDPVPLYQIEVDQDFLEKDIEQKRQEFGETLSPEEVEAGDILYGKLQEVDESGLVLIGGYERMIVLNPTRIDKPSVFEPFVGKSLEYATPWNPFSLEDSPEKLAEILFMEPEELEAIQGKSFTFTLKRINRYIPAEKDPAFFRKVLEYLRHEDAQQEADISEEQFVDVLKEMMEKEFENEGRNYFIKQVKDQLIAQHYLELPEEFMKKQFLESLRQQQTPPNHIDQQFQNYLRSMRWSLIVDKIIEANPDLKIKEEEMRESIRELFLQYNPQGLPDSEMDSVVDNAMQNQHIIESQSNRILEKKLADFFIESFNPATQPITATDYLELLQKTE